MCYFIDLCTFSFHVSCLSEFAIADSEFFWFKYGCFVCFLMCLSLGLDFDLLPYGNYSGLYSSPWRPAFVFLLSFLLHA